MTLFEITALVVLVVCFGIGISMLMGETYIAELFRRTLEYHHQKRWLRMIERESVRYNKYKAKANQAGYVAKALLNRYNELYGEDENHE